MNIISFYISKVFKIVNYEISGINVNLWKEVPVQIKSHINMMNIYYAKAVVLSKN